MSGKCDKIGAQRGCKACVHYWIIEGSEGPVSKGVCKLCGAECEFENFVRHKLGR